MSISINVPNKPSSAGVDFTDQKQAMDFSQKMADYNFALQTLKSIQDNENSTRSNMAKSSDDALKNTIANLK